MFHDTFVVFFEDPKQFENVDGLDTDSAQHQLTTTPDLWTFIGDDAKCILHSFKSVDQTIVSEASKQQTH